MFGGFDDSRLVVLAGVRRTATLSRGEHVFVDDLVTSATAQGRGYGTAMLRWLGRKAAPEGLARMHLDARATAKSFYEKLGFTFVTAVPGWIEIDRLVGSGAS